MSSADSLGHSTSKTNIILVIDLDETLLSINSFPVWAKYFLLGKFDNLNFIRRNLMRLKAAKIFAERKALKRSHAKTKAALHKLWLKYNDISALEKILAMLEPTIRPNMLNVMDLIRQSKIDAILATAAASLYAEPFAKKIGFANVISTGLNEAENRSEEKARRAQKFIENKNWQNRKKIFFTDHLEDMPFMLNSDKLMWFGKTEEVEIISQSVADLEIIICRNLSAEEIVGEIK